uniref:NADH-ubiquinone oxidoreductase chain 5 n=1 Tax=Empoasca flavescens TaxID=317765 RepID=A0A5J6YA11_9HEMI|nr:NADH dehydrogenase subunit 5 [Empoasca flavescens]
MKKINLYYSWGGVLMILSVIMIQFSMSFLNSSKNILIEWTIISINSFNLNYIMFFDWISLMFMSVVMIISSMVILYSSEYMGIKSFSSNRFLFLVLMFILSMMLMIISPNMISILLGWDGLGLVSYCLVIFYNSLKSYLAGMLTCLVNRLGDIGLIISVSWLSCYGSWNFLFYLEKYNYYMYMLIIVSSFTKSAQIPFSMWLPAAMAAPTPVSSLVHSSTLVTAGVYLLIRFFNKLQFNNFWFVIISMMTMMMSSFCALYEFDLKKIIALSTLSQLGLMMSSLFFGLSEMTFFHLCTHAMFKSLLFLCAGIFIFHMNDNQDIRCMGPTCIMMPYTTSCFMISNITLCGMPFLSGFYSKDLIVELYSSGMCNSMIYMLFYISLSLTVLYTIRLIYYSLMFNVKNNSMNLFLEKLNMMKYSILILVINSTMFGCMMGWLTMMNTTLIMLTFNIKLLTTMMIISGVILSLEYLKINKYMMMNYYYEITNMWMMFNYSYYIFKLTYKFIFKYKNMLNWGEIYGPRGLSYLLISMSNKYQLYYISNFKILLISFLIWLTMMI